MTSPIPLVFRVAAAAEPDAVEWADATPTEHASNGASKI